MNSIYLAGVLSYIGMTNDEYGVIGGKVDGAINTAEITATRLIGYDVAQDDPNKERVQQYINTRVFLDLYGDALTTGILSYHLDRISEMEEQLRYTKRGV